MVDPDYRAHIRQTRFRRALLGYRRRDVRQHLDRVVGWFSLAGVDELLDQRTRELASEAERLIAEAESEATRIVADANRDADEIRQAAREEARAVVEQARRETARERRGWSRIGRPVGARFNGG
jgi:DivIVA domain-containing protein